MAVPNPATKSSAVAVAVAVVAIGYLINLSDFLQSQLKYDLYELMIEELMVEEFMVEELTAAMIPQAAPCCYMFVSTS